MLVSSIPRLILNESVDGYSVTRCQPRLHGTRVEEKYRLYRRGRVLPSPTTLAHSQCLCAAAAGRKLV
jgi:hypothetical protein